MLMKARPTEGELAVIYRASVIADTEDTNARNALVEMHLPLVRWAAQKIHSANLHHTELEELVNIGCLGMMEGLRRFDPAKGYRVSTYCLFWVKNAMHQHVRATRWNGFVSEAGYRQLMKVHKALSRLPVQFNGGVSIVALAEASGIDQNVCHRLYALTRAMVAIETPLSKNGKLKLGDRLRQEEGPSDAFCIAHNQVAELVQEALATLSAEEQIVVKFQFLTETVYRPVTEEQKKIQREIFKKLKKLSAIKKAHDVMESFETK